MTNQDKETCCEKCYGTKNYCAITSCECHKAEKCECGCHSGRYLDDEITEDGCALCYKEKHSPTQSKEDLRSTPERLSDQEEEKTAETTKELKELKEKTTPVSLEEGFYGKSVADLELKGQIEDNKKLNKLIDSASLEDSWSDFELALKILLPKDYHLNKTIYETIKDFIRKEREQSYEEGKTYEFLRISALQPELSNLVRQATLSEVQRIVEGMKKPLGTWSDQDQAFNSVLDLILQALNKMKE